MIQMRESTTSFLGHHHWVIHVSRAGHVDAAWRDKRWSLDGINVGYITADQGTIRRPPGTTAGKQYSALAAPWIVAMDLVHRRYLLRWRLPADCSQASAWWYT
jgi:hypothetical protein